jgi:monoamine oxidase
MSRSLFAKLHRRFGQRSTGEARRRRADAHYARLREAMPVGLVDGPQLAANRSARVAVIGGGFAGCSAAWFAARAGMSVTLIEPRAVVGGRVSSTKELVDGRILEAGAELIGTNHPMWMAFARHFGLAMSAISTEDQYDAADLAMTVMLGGHRLTLDEQKKVYGEMDDVFRAWARDAEVVTSPWKPWTTPNAEKLDAETVEGHIPNGLDELTKAAIRTEFEMNNTTPASEQSWLGNLAQISAGGGYDSFEDTEVFRCAAGNQALAKRLAARLDVDKHRVTNIRTGDQIFVDLESGERNGPFDYIIVAVPSVAMEKLTIDGAAFPLRAAGHGPAVKYLSGVEQRFWITEGLAPTGMSDQLGMFWEGTDNQMDTARFDVSLFAGGRAAQAAIDAGGSAAYFAPRLKTVLPNYSAYTTGFQNWPRWIGMGYSCPRPGEVTTIQKSYADLIGGRIAVAGEHTSPPWFGYMEGALESGLVATARIAQQAGITIPSEFGRFRAV